MTDKDKSQKEKEAYLRKYAEAIRNIPGGKAKKSYIVTTVKKGMGIGKIAKVTELPKEEIKKLLK